MLLWITPPIGVKAGDSYGATFLLFHLDWEQLLITIVLCGSFGIIDTNRSEQNIIIGMYGQKQLFSEFKTNFSKQLLISKQVRYLIFRKPMGNVDY